MEVLFNGRICEQDQVQLVFNNRAFAYGDGIFETMVVRRGTCSLLGYHYKRLQQGVGILGMESPFSLQQLEGYIWELSTKSNNNLQKMRLQLWRRNGGLYAPEQSLADFILTSSEFNRPVWVKEKVCFSESVHLTPSPFSHLKTMSALPYVLAGLEMKSRKLDDVILTDTKGHVAEGSSSNLFWFSDGKWYTPHLKSGCIAGVMRAYLLDKLKEKNIPVQEILLPKERLMDAELLIACNATGLYTIKNLEYHTFESGRELLTQFIQLPAL